MIPILVVLAFGAGLVWADGGHAIAASHWIAGVGCVGALLSGGSIVRRLARDPSSVSRRVDPTPNGIRILGSTCALGLVFLAGFDRLDTELERARVDRRRAEAIAPTQTRLAEARVRARRSGRWGERVELDSVRAVDAATPLPSRLTLFLADFGAGPHGSGPNRGDRLLWPGAWVRLGLRISPMRAPRNPGTPDRDRAAARRGVSARARLVKPDWVLDLTRDATALSGARPAMPPRAVERRRLTERLSAAGPGSGLVRALALGDRSAVSDELSDAFQRLGLAHLLAISGLHVGFVAGLSGWLVVRASAAWRLGSGRRMPFDAALVFACATAAAYAGITGAGVSVERATLIFGLFVLSRFARRVVSPASALAWVALMILWVDPGALFDRGAQLSFGACAALVAGGIWTRTGAREIDPDDPTAGEGRGARVWRMLRETFRASLVVSLGTAPLLAWHDLPLSLLSPVVNVVAIPWLGFGVLPTSLAATAAAALDGCPQRLIDAAVFPAGLFAQAVQLVAEALPDPPHWALLSTPWMMCVASIGLLASRAGEGRVAAMAWVALALTSAPPTLPTAFDAGTPGVLFFDVGQGDAALVRGRHAAILIDAGPGPPDGSGGLAVLRGLHAMGVFRLDVLAITHGDLDHRGGARRILESLPVGELWLPVTGRADASLQDLSERAARQGTRVRWLGPRAPAMRRGDLEIDVLWPDRVAITRSRNETSLVLRVSVDGIRALFTADIGASVEDVLLADPSRLSVDVLKVAHHGSRRSSSAAFLASTSPEFVVVSAPCDATRGLPNVEVLDRLEDLGAALGWTGRDGAVWLTRTGSPRALTLRRWAAPRRCRS